MTRSNSDHDEHLWATVTEGVTPLRGRLRPAAPHRRAVRASRVIIVDPGPRELSADLHGLTLAEAHRTVIRLVHRAAAEGVRRLHVVTGKGLGRNGATIRGEFKHWLEASEVRAFVLSVRHAPRERGGDGAFTVMLRRSK